MEWGAIAVVELTVYVFEIGVSQIHCAEVVNVVECEQCGILEEAA